MAFGDGQYQRAQRSEEDVLGLDRLGRAFLRVLVRMPPGGLVAVQGAPGSGKREFLRRLAFLASDDARAIGLPPTPGIHPTVVWYDVWSYVKEGPVVSGLVAHIARAGPNPASLLERARDMASHLTRMTFDGSASTGFGGALNQGSADPVDRVHAGFRSLVEGFAGENTGRVLVFVEGLDALPAARRWELLDGARFLMNSGANLTVVVAIGREAALSAIRHREGGASDASATRDLDQILDLNITMPPLDVRRIGTLLRRYLGEGELVLRHAFGDAAVKRLTAAAAHRSLGTPRFLQRVAARSVLLAEFAHEVRATTELSDAQWAWVVISERWPEFRRFFIRGGRERWVELKAAISHLSAHGVHTNEPVALEAGAVVGLLADDPILAEYIEAHTEGFDRHLEGVFWLENLLLAAGQ